MTKQELWAIYVRRNPSFEGEGNITLAKKGLKKLFNTTWDTAYFDGEPDHIGEANNMVGGDADSIAVEQFKSIFGFR